VNSRYALESRRSKDVNFNNLKDSKRPDAALADMHKMQLARIQTGALSQSLIIVGSIENRGLYLPFTNRQIRTL
jgi:hypothetical protein